MEKSDFFKPALEWAKRRGLSKIKANFTDYESPVHFTRRDEEQSFVPDITGYRLGVKHYVEIATKEEDVPKKVSKWKLMAKLAGMKGGRLFLLAPKGHKAFAERIVKRYNVNAKVVYLQ
ncbi:MAG TPA: hypothetical protein PKE06_13940 [Flavilitoribacter sp.]|mgnify:CR=1 FL=1|nr:hypothetical protein [Lewinella sp.]MCB9281209.1 hypothetical protein [Lewinellaceae bacterium]HMQ61769.1 hypothetical protein [Flavilitoribacter sp.]HMQ90912.1 hypothetical protein [Flavilitoribacter sp.]